MFLPLLAEVAATHCITLGMLALAQDPRLPALLPLPVKALGEAADGHVLCIVRYSLHLRAVDRCSDPDALIFVVFYGLDSIAMVPPTVKLAAKAIGAG